MALGGISIQSNAVLQLHSGLLGGCRVNKTMEWPTIIIYMHDDRGEAAQKGLSFKHHLPLDLRALAPPDDLCDMLEWNPVVRPLASYQTYSDYNIVASAVKVSNQGCCHTVSQCIWRQMNVSLSLHDSKNTSNEQLKKKKSSFN